jgi:DNA-3-methyladenine glycosylase I
MPSIGADGLPRCSWGISTPDYLAYHDTEWGFPVDDDRLLFEKVCLEGFQSGLSWLTILRKRDDFRRVFHDFDFEKVATMAEPDVDRLLGDSTIIRHRGKIEATINNAIKLLDVIAEFGSFAAYVWAYEPDTSDPSRSVSAESVAMSKDLKRRGFRFVGPTTAYAFMQAMGLVNDHVVDCFVCPLADEARRGFVVPSRA